MQKKTNVVPTGLVALKRVHRRVADLRRKYQQMAPTVPSALNREHVEEKASVCSIIEKWLHDEIKLMEN